MRKNKRGAVTIEAAIAFTITLVLIASIVSAIDFYRTDILMRRSVEQTCEKMALLHPVSVPSADLMSAAVNAFPDLGVGDTKGGEIISKVFSIGAGLDNATGQTLKELILQGLFSKTMEEQIRNAYIERNGGSDFFAPRDIEVFFAINSRHHVIEVLTEYSVVTIAGTKTRSIYSVIPLYGEPVLMLNSEESKAKEKDKDNIWSLSNFDRGEAFRDKYGANLPKTFPVIQSATINGKKYEVTRVDSRHLKVIIPENSGQIGRETVENLKGYAFVQGVILEICEYETSERYRT